MKRLLTFLVFVFLTALSSKAQIIVTGNITSNTTWTNNNIYILNGWVYVKSGATLTIQPGTLIKGDNVSKGALIIERGAKIVADGTIDQPIVFTSQKAPGQRSFGDWGGVILCGRASINQPGDTAVIEGGVGSIYGGGASPNDDDSSGVLRYVRIEFAGIAFQPNNEINGLTCGGVGRKTKIEYVQISYSGDDAVECFGGTVNLKHFVCYASWDDDFDTDNGYRGKVQFGISLRDPQFADQSGSNGHESDNDAAGSTNTPTTHPIYSNMTIIGPKANSLTYNSNYQRALHIRRNSELCTYNSVYIGYPFGLYIDGTLSQTNATNGDLQFRHDVLCQMTDTLLAQVGGQNQNGSFNIGTWFNTPGFNNQIVNLATQLGIAGYAIGSPDFHLLSNSMLLTGADFTNSNLQNSFFEPVSYLGAFGETDWTKCWTDYDPQNNPYAQATDNSITATITPSGSTEFCQGGSVTLSSDAAATYLWSDGETTQSITVSSTGTFTLTVTNSAKCEAISTPTSVTVHPTPNATITVTGNTTFCTGDSVVLMAPSASSYNWSDGSTTQTDVVYTSGSYLVTVTDANSCTNVSQIITVSAGSAPSPTVSVNGDLEFCDGGSVILTSTSADSYNWSNGATTQSITVTAGGSYTVTVTNADPCNGTGPSAATAVTVDAKPVAGFTMTTGGSTVTFTNNTSGATSYLWDFGDGILSNQQNTSHAYTANGTYNVILTATNADGCTDQSTQSVDISTVGIKDITPLSFESINVYPNPANTTSTVEFTVNTQTDLTIAVYDVTGRQVLVLGQGNYVPGTHKVTSDISMLESGMYFIVVSDKQQHKVQQLAVVR